MNTNIDFPERPKDDLLAILHEHGLEPTNICRPWRNGEWFVGASGVSAIQADCDGDPQRPRWILRKVETSGDRFNKSMSSGSVTVPSAKPPCNHHRFTRECYQCNPYSANPSKIPSASELDQAIYALKNNWRQTDPFSPDVLVDKKLLQRVILAHQYPPSEISDSSNFNQLNYLLEFICKRMPAPTGDMKEFSEWATAEVTVRSLLEEIPDSSHEKKILSLAATKELVDKLEKLDDIRQLALELAEKVVKAFPHQSGLLTVAEPCWKPLISLAHRMMEVNGK